MDLKHHWWQKWQTKAVLLQAHYEKVRVFCTIMLGKIKVSRTRGRPNTRWTDFIKEGIDTIYRIWAGMLRTRQSEQHSFTNSLGVGADSTMHNTHSGTSMWVWEGKNKENSCRFNAVLSRKETISLFQIVKNILWGLTLSNWDLNMPPSKGSL